MKKIPNFPNYFADIKGNIFSIYAGYHNKLLKKPRKLKQLDRKSGYKFVIIVDKYRKRRYKSVHTLILETFKGIPQKKQECRHLNGIRNDNRLKNLKWGTRLENCQDKINSGNTLRGEKCHFSKLKDNDVLKIRKLFKNGLTTMEIAKIFKIGYVNIYYIITNRTWKNLL